MNEIIISKKK